MNGPLPPTVHLLPNIPYSASPNRKTPATNHHPVKTFVFLITLNSKSWSYLFNMSIQRSAIIRLCSCYPTGCLLME